MCIRDRVYVYHNQIDARGDKASTENEVFAACEEAVDEIFALIKRLTVSANTIHYIITADHGFLYKRDKLQESDKIGGIPGAGRRFALSAQAVSYTHLTRRAPGSWKARRTCAAVWPSFRTGL